jgi:phage-related tail fiber protein
VLTDGKQIKANSIPASKLVSTYETSLFLKDGSRALTGTVDAGSQRITNLGAPTAPSDAARLQDLFDRSAKQVVRAATTANITLSGTQTIDGVSVIAGDRVLVKDQSTASGNGVYVVAAGAWSRAADSDSATELLGATYVVTEGTANADRVYLQTADNITVGTTSLAFIQVGSQSAQAYPTASNKNMTASVTSADFQAACATTIVGTPAGDAWVGVYVNGCLQVLGDGVKTRDCYFSADSGATAKSIANITAGDTLYWVGSVAGFQLAATDIIDLTYNV